MRPNSRNRGINNGTRLTKHSIFVALSAIVALLIGASALPAQDNISDLMQRARRSFRPVSNDEPAEARAQLRKRMNELTDYVNPSSENGKRWLRYLRWDALK